jgi:polyphosphate kinase
VAPVEDALLREEIMDMMERCFADNSNSWELGPDGEWTRIVRAEGEPRRDVQLELRERAATRAAEQLTAAG